MDDQTYYRLLSEIEQAVKNTVQGKDKGKFYQCECIFPHATPETNQASYNTGTGFFTCFGKHGVIPFYDKESELDMFRWAGCSLLEPSNPHPLAPVRLPREDKPKKELIWNPQWVENLQSPMLIDLQDWLVKRGVTGDFYSGRLGFTGDDKGLTWGEQNKLIIPWFDYFAHPARLDGAKTRSLPGQDKFYGSLTGSNYAGLFNLHPITYQFKRVVLFESELDALAFSSWWQVPYMGLATPASKGAWTEYKASLLFGLEVFVAVDDDETGHRHFEAIRATIPSAVKLLPIAGCKDAGEGLQKHGEWPYWPQLMKEVA